MDLTARPTMTTKGNTRPGRSAIYDRLVFIAFIAAPSIAVTNNRSHLGIHSSLRLASVSRCVCVGLRRSPEALVSKAHIPVLCSAGGQFDILVPDELVPCVPS